MVRGMAKMVPVREFRAQLAALLDEVDHCREHVIVTRRGRPAAVLVSVEEYRAMTGDRPPEDGDGPTR